MASFSGLLQRPFSAAAAFTVAAMSLELPDHIWQPKLAKFNAEPSAVSVTDSQLTVLDHGTASKLSRFKVFKDVNFNIPERNMQDSLFRSFSLPFGSPAVALQAPYQYAKLANPRTPINDGEFVPVLSSKSDTMYLWHLPKPCNANGNSGDDKLLRVKSQTVVVLLGWLGAKQKHLKRYADWYTSRGFHVVTFTLPLSEIMSYKVVGKAEQDVELLAEHLAGWVSEENGKNMVFHTFSNTGWLTYGVLLEKFQKQDESPMEKIKGCIVDSAPVASPDPQVWASGFSAAFLKKHSIATKGMSSQNCTNITTASKSVLNLKPAITETALLVLLEKFFNVVLNLPSINRRLADVLDLLTLKQPKCPQLYIYSSADRVIPAKSVESFVEIQRGAGHEVNACDFLSSPHVDHFRSHPGLYTSVLSNFLEDHVLTCYKNTSQIMESASV